VFVHFYGYTCNACLKWTPGITRKQVDKFTAINNLYLSLTVKCATSEVRNSSVRPVIHLSEWPLSYRILVEIFLFQAFSQARHVVTHDGGTISVLDCTRRVSVAESLPPANNYCSCGINVTRNKPTNNMLLNLGSLDR
jgi:hypothetical protein